jgi:hypothetical protein
VRDTRLNLASSRSHQIVRLYIESRPPSDGCPDSPASVSTSKGAGGDGEDDWRPVTSASLCFVDLAGSERTSLGATEEADSRLRQTEVITAVGLKRDVAQYSYHGNVADQVIFGTQGGAINKSLLTLGNVIRALAEGKVRSAACLLG